MRSTVSLCLAVTSVACSQPIGVEWKRALPAASVSTPLVTASFIAVGHELGVTILEPDGTPRCVFPTHHDVISAPQTDGKRIFFGSTNYVFYAIDSGCTEVWRFPTGDRIKSDPLVADGKVFASSYDGHVYAFDAESGRQLWVFPPVAAATAVTVPAAPVPDPGAKPKKKGKKAEPAPEPPVAPPVVPVPAEEVDVGDFSYSSPALVNGVLYLGNLDQHLYAIDAATGAPKNRFKTLGAVTSSPVADASGTFLYFGSNDNNVYALDLRTFTKSWTFATLDWVNSSPRLTPDTVFIGSNDRHVYALERLSGKLRWSYETRGPAISIPALTDELVIAAGASGDGAVYAIQRESGTLFWRYETDGKIESDPVVVGDKIYVSSADSNLYLFQIKPVGAR
jgi:outer membrane protein assembly factor BamB